MKIDKATADGEFGHYACVLIEFDSLVKPIDCLMIERVGKNLFIEVAYENLLAFCSTSSLIGHIPSACRLNKTKGLKASVVGVKVVDVQAINAEKSKKLETETT